MPHHAMKIAVSLPDALLLILDKPTVTEGRLMAEDRQRRRLMTAGWLRDALQRALDQQDPRLQAPLAELVAELQRRKAYAWADAVAKVSPEDADESADGLLQGCVEMRLLGRVVEWLRPPEELTPKREPARSTTLGVGNAAEEIG